MSLRMDKESPGARARSTQEKAAVREALIAAGRRLFEMDPKSASLRRIAAEAGYSPATVYQYFGGQEELLAYVRGREVKEATQALREMIADEPDAERRLLRLLTGTAQYWLEHMNDFLLVIPAPSLKSAELPQGMVAFGRSEPVLELFGLYENAVTEFLATVAAPPVSPRVGTHVLLAAVYGTIAMPHMARTIEWSSIPLMVEMLVTALLRQWSAGAMKP